MRLLQRRKAMGAARVFAVTEYGPEPVGAAQADALTMDRNALLNMPDRMGVPVGWGLSGSFPKTDQSVWISPQQFFVPNVGSSPLQVDEASQMAFPQTSLSPGLTLDTQAGQPNLNTYT